MLTTIVVSNKKPPLLSVSESGGSTSHKEQVNKALPIDPTNAYKNGTLEEIMTSIIQAIYKQENYNQTRTAKRLGIGRTTLRRKLGLQ